MADLILVEATIHLFRLPPGRRVMVDPDVPYIARCLEQGYLIRVWETASSDDDVPDSG